MRIVTKKFSTYSKKKQNLREPPFKNSDENCREHGVEARAAPVSTSPEADRDLG